MLVLATVAPVIWIPAATIGTLCVVYFGGRKLGLFGGSESV
jgi:hypothetical protein